MPPRLAGPAPRPRALRHRDELSAEERRARRAERYRLLLEGIALLLRQVWVRLSHASCSRNSVTVPNALSATTTPRNPLANARRSVAKPSATWAHCPPRRERPPSPSGPSRALADGGVDFVALEARRLEEQSAQSLVRVPTFEKAYAGIAMGESVVVHQQLAVAMDRA